jgi:hypothetical protein
MDCHHCNEEITLPSNNVRFKSPGKDEYVFFHNSEGKQCWRQYMLARVNAARPTQTAHIQTIEAVQAT